MWPSYALLRSSRPDGSARFISGESAPIVRRNIRRRSFRTIKVRKQAGVKGRWHDNRHTLVTEFAESGAGDEVIMRIAEHVSRAMLSRYSLNSAGAVRL
jgi:hypothetical protein